MRTITNASILDNLIMNQRFIDYFQAILSQSEFEAFLGQIEANDVKRALRINTLLVKSPKECLGSEFKKIKRIPWSPDGYFYESDESIGNTEAFKKGEVYSQEAASQVAAYLLEPKKNDYILDMCASPGSKTTQIASMVANSALVIANEVAPDRFVKLRNNLHHFGVVCHGITSLDTMYFAENYPNTFDKILVDAPCSGEGMYFKFPAVIKHWNLKTVKFNAKRQKKILTDAFLSLKPGGRLVYSTCTLNMEENEKVVADILKKFFGNAEIVNADMKKIGLYVKGGTRKTFEPMLKIWPHEFGTGGFFACVITKKTPTEIRSDVTGPRLTAKQRKQAAHKNQKKDVREGWNICMKKEVLSVLNNLSKQAGVKSISLPNEFAVTKKSKEYYLQYYSFYKRFADLPVKSVGIKLVDEKGKATPEALVWLKTL